MSVANNSERGNRYNMPYQLAVLQLLDQINNSISVIPGIDYETRTTMYQAQFEKIKHELNVVNQLIFDKQNVKDEPNK